MGLREKYDHAIQTAKGFRMQGSAEERDGKLYFKGTTQTQEEANKIWDAIKTNPDWRNDIIADIQAVGPAQAAPAQAAPAQAAAPAKAAERTYTVQAGDTLSKIAKQFLGNAASYNEIFNLNRDQLSDPDKIKPGQVLKIPAASGQ